MILPACIRENRAEEVRTFRLLILARTFVEEVFLYNALKILWRGTR